MNFKQKDKDGLFRSIFTAYFILLLHVFLLAGAGVTVVLFKGVYHYLPWIMGCIGILVLAIAWIFYRRVKNSSSDIKNILSMPQFQDKTVEIRLLGGLASFKITPKEKQKTYIGHHPPTHLDRLLIEKNINPTEQKILELTALFKKDLITKEEFEAAKHNILQG
ncbi:MAG: SHOCT domain-containing protein [Proteobacteria bacterium]|nr:SHOCT domain-containing protein [Pseudomonadota bacterium]MBU1582867.1 SHOCT domain-containing protein [Pseudomonadota bacterium]MBU2452790.1 SHOCT domain-containing protein [Pseudomonadota bacterium]MBU2629484.1 SHOCT domain-containing protein [Pseudomonadota bacterium]